MIVKTIPVTNFQTNCYIYNTDKKNCVIIDPGGDENIIIESINQNDFIPKLILLTHSHPDHLAALPGLKAKYNVPFAVHNNESELFKPSAMKQNKDILYAMGFTQDIVENICNNIPFPEMVLNDNDMIQEFQLSVIHTPGHTPGSCCFYAKENSLLFSGDTLFNFGIGRTDFPGGDTQKILSSIKEKLFILPENTEVYPGHGPKTNIDIEKNHNPFF